MASSILSFSCSSWLGFELAHGVKDHRKRDGDGGERGMVALGLGLGTLFTCAPQRQCDAKAKHMRYNNLALLLFVGCFSWCARIGRARGVILGLWG